MLKYEKIIEMLSVQQKIRLLCDISVLANPEYTKLGIPSLNIVDFEDECVGYPSPQAMANSWNTELIRDTAVDAAEEIAANGGAFLMLPSARAKFNPYAKALSEDSRLSYLIAQEYVDAANEAGTASCIRGFSIHGGDVEWLDNKPDGRFIYENIINPYLYAFENNRAEGIAVLPDIKAENYERSNSALIKTALRYKTFSGSAMICEKASAENTLSCILNGIICFKGDSLALDSALNKYLQIKKAVEQDNLSAEELEKSVSGQKAISPEMIDIAVDRVIDFAFNANKKRPSSSKRKSVSDELLTQSAREAIVLLENNKKTLPLDKTKNVCILGDIVYPENAGEFSDELSKELGSYGYNIIGMGRGYDFTKERSEELIPDALELASRADNVLLFLGFGKRRERRITKSAKLSLPANQVALLSELGKAKCKVTAIVSADYPADIVMYECADALLFAPILADKSAKAIAEVLSGEYSPCGKLAHTVYQDSDRILKKRKNSKARGLKCGPFVGYKYYDTSEYYPKYAFGYGLSYSKFAYSSITATENEVTFTVKNKGKMRAAEVAQVYIGINDSKVIRPKKELCSFAKIELEAGESRTVTLPIYVPEIFNVESGQFSEEEGIYTLYVGSSVEDIRLVADIHMGDEKIMPDGEVLSDYLLSESNIISDNYKLEADCDIMKKSVLNIIAGIAAILIAVLLKVYCIATDSNALFFDIISIILVIFGWVFFVAEVVARRKDKKTDDEAVKQANDEAFAEAETIEVSSAEQLFVREFDVNYQETEIAAAAEHSEGIEAENMVFVDSNYDIATANKEFAAVAKEKGIEFDENDANRLFSSMASSRVLLFHSVNEKAFASLMQLLGNYFQAPVCLDKAENGSYENIESVLFKADATGAYTKTNAMLAIESAKEMPQNIHFVGMDGIKASKMADWAAPIVKHARNPYAHNIFKAHNEQNVETSYYFPENVWFAINLSPEEVYSAIPSSVAEIAAVNTFAVNECPPVANYEPVHGFTYYQMEYFCDKLSSSLSVGEDVWKKLDKFEKFVSSHASFSLGNRLWLSMEKYISLAIACGIKCETVIDECMAAKILPSVIIALNGKISAGEAGLMETMAAIFGEENIFACKKALKASGADIS
ncbi:MAG: glycoside hydrolase family 3 C-terminal domain-containing protein [Clostridia bacterium]|nr:glycoside hydrolase family 3 C-terminal domain-containing protein [Clostridia bacterium]